MNAAARLVTNTRKFDRGLTYSRCHVLYWLDVGDRIKFRLCVTVCTRMAPGYLPELCRPVSALQGRRYLRSADCNHLDFLRVLRQTVVCISLHKQSRALSHCGISLKDV